MHPSLLSMSLDEIWQCFSVECNPCVYSITSMAHKQEYIGSTINWRSRCYQHSRHIYHSGISGEQSVHVFVQKYLHEYVFVPLSQYGGAALESRLIKSFSPALNIQQVPAQFRSNKCLAVKKPGCGRKRRHVQSEVSVCKYTSQGHVFLQLFGVLCLLAPKHCGVVNVSKGSQWLDNSKILLRAFGDSRVTCVPLGVSDTPLRQVWQDLKGLSAHRALCVCFTDVSQVHPFLLAKPTLIGLLANRSTVRDLYHYTEAHCFDASCCTLHPCAFAE